MIYVNELDLTKGKNNKEPIVYQYWYFSHGFKSQNSVCNSCHDLTTLCLSDITIITVKGTDYRCVIQDISKPNTNHLLENSVLDDHGYI